MILPIKTIGDPILEKPCEEVDLKILQENLKFHKRVSNDTGCGCIDCLIKSMIETARAHDAVGLAANQVGESLRIFIYRTYESWESANKDEFEVAINPKITSPPYTVFKTTDIDEEGCLSIPYIWGMVGRAPTIEVEYFNEKGKKINRNLSGLAARVYAHELDHLNGVLFVERTFGGLYYRK